MAYRKIVKRFLSGVVIRYPRMGDLDDLLSNINSLVAERAFIAIQKEQTRAEERKWLLLLLKDIKKKKKVVLVAEIQGKVVGLANVGKNQEEAMSHVGDFGIGLIKEARGRHIGELLLKAVIAEAQRILGIKIVVLSAIADNCPAVNCYRKCGFMKTETMKGGIRHYGKYLDRIRMVKYL